MKKIILSLFVLVSSIVLKGQTENTLYFIDNVFQSHYSNPVAIPQAKVSVGLPVISSLDGYVNIDYLTVNNITNEVNGEREFDEDLLAQNPNLKDKNYINYGLRYELFHLQFKVNHSYLSFHVSDRFDFSYRYPKDFVRLLAEGNSNLVGESLDLKNMAVNASHYREFGLGWVHEGDKWNFGGRAKVLFGLSNVKTDFKSADFRIDQVGGDSPGHVVTGFIDGTVYTSGIDTTEQDDNERIQNYALNTDNLGFAVDFGATYKMNDRLELSASFLDLGFIKWNSNNINYNFDGDTSYVGYDPLDSYFNDEDENVSTSLDSLAGEFDYTESNEAYTTTLKYKINFSAKYKFGRASYLTGLLNFNNYAGFRPALSVGIHQEVKRWLNVSVTNSIQNHKFFNLGVGVTANLGPIQLYFVTDKLNSVFNFYDTSYANFHFGLNLIFGKVMYQEKLPLDK